MAKEYEFVVSVSVQELHTIEAENYEQAEDIFLSCEHRNIKIIQENIDTWEVIK